MCREVPSAAVRTALSAMALFVAIGTPAGVLAMNVTPTNLPATFCNDTVSGTLFVSVPKAVNTDTDCASVVTQPNGPSLCLIRYNAVNITEFGSLTLSGSRPLVLTSQTSLIVAGGIVVGAGSNPGTVDMNGLTEAGGGGGGGATPGGPGGNDSGGNGAGNAGGVHGSNALHPLVGGMHGAQGGGSSLAPGGSGGGALQLVACGTLSITGSVYANGYGGQGGAGAGAASDANGGGGGGAGGNLLLEGNNVSIDAALSANGGSGGGGGTNTAGGGSNGMPGQPGSGVSPAGGGAAATATAGKGGNGGARAVTPTAGGSASSASSAGGGGGGAAGYIRINSCAGLLATPTSISPDATFGLSCTDVIFRDGFDA